MNEVRHSLMDSVVMAVVAQREAVAYIMPKFGVVLDSLNVVRFKATPRAAVPALVPVSGQHGTLPCEVFRAAPSLTLRAVESAGDAAAPRAAKYRRAYSFAGMRGELLAALLTGEGADVPPAGDRAVDDSPNVGRRAVRLDPAGRALHAHLPGLVRRAARAGTETLLAVFRPAPIWFFPDNLAARFTRVQGFVCAHTLNISNSIDSGAA